MKFALIAFVGMFVGRKIGWSLSKGFFYVAPMVLAVAGVAVWGIVVGYGMSYLIGATHPNLILRWILGFALGAYVAIPNFGLFNESTLPDSVMSRHFMISTLPLVTYIVTEVATYSMR
ncbi:MAG: hypothetical protein ACRD3L_14650 [Terriglobales bacterium]